MYQIFSGGKDITDQLQSSIVSIEITDEAGSENDRARIVFTGEDVSIPERGNNMRITIAGVAMGDYVVRRIELSGPPDSIIVIAHAVDHSGSMKAVRNQCFAGGLLGDFLASMAVSNGYVAAIDSGLAKIQVTSIQQTNESDLQCLKRLGKEHDAFAAVKQGHLIFKPLGTVHSVTGQPLSTHSIAKTAVSRYSASEDNKAKYKSTTVRYRNIEAAITESVTLGEGQPVYVHSEIMPDKTTAEQRVKALHAQQSRAQMKLEIDVPAMPHIQTEHQLTLQGFHQRIPADWVVSKVVHNLKATLTTKVTAQQKTSSS